jgi:hypothetical protein
MEGKKESIVVHGFCINNTQYLVNFHEGSLDKSEVASDASQRTQSHQSMYRHRRHLKSK